MRPSTNPERLSERTVTMIAATDASYRGEKAIAAGILFDGWTADRPSVKICELIRTAEPYRPGFFFKRELPCLLEVLDRLRGRFETVIVDGYVWLGPDGKPGLGAHLFEALGRNVVVIGVAKSSFRGSSHAVRVFRGAARRPLYVTAVGIDQEAAARNILMMHGPHRIPALLKMTDRLSRGCAAIARDEIRTEEQG